MAPSKARVSEDASSRDPADFTIRPFADPDTAGLVALWDACGLVTPWNDPHKDIDRKMAVDPTGLLIAMVDDRLIGSVMAGYEGHRGWVNYLAVAPSHRRQGLGTRLMREAEMILADRGCPKINIQVRATNADVIAFYGGLGYSVESVVNLGRRLHDD